MQEKDKLSFRKKPRIIWFNVIIKEFLYPEFCDWLRNHCKNIKSLNRKSFLFLKSLGSICGNDYINWALEHPDFYTHASVKNYFSRLFTIVSTPWIKVDGELLPRRSIPDLDIDKFESALRQDSENVGIKYL